MWINRTDLRRDPPENQKWTGPPLVKVVSLDSDGSGCQRDGCLKMRVLTVYRKSEVQRLNLTVSP